MGVMVDLPSALVQKAGVKSPANAKLIVYGVYAIAGIIVVVIMVRQVKKFLGIGSVPVDKHPVYGDLTLTKDDAKSIADRLWGNLHGNLICSFDSVMTDVPDKDALTDGDKKMIYNAFGKHTSGFPFYTEGDLFFWLDRKIKFGINDAKEYWGY